MFKAWPLAKSAGVTSSSVLKCPNYKYGDFQCNAAMSLCKALKVCKHEKTKQIPRPYAPPPCLSMLDDAKVKDRSARTIYVCPMCGKHLLKAY